MVSVRKLMRGMSSRRNLGKAKTAVEEQQQETASSSYEARDEQESSESTIKTQETYLPSTQMNLVSIVEKTEERAMRITDLQTVAEVIRQRCEMEQWTSTLTGELLSPEQVNLYDLNYYYIQPKTVPNGVVLHGLEDREYRMGQVIYQVHENECEQYKKPYGRVLKDSTTGSVWMSVEKGKFNPDLDTFVQEDAESPPENIGSPSFVEFNEGKRSSLKEILHSAPTKPDWFISHTWSDSVLKFVERCEYHARSYCTTWTPQGKKFDQDKYNSYSYWICAYANNQHELATEINSSPVESAFMKAIMNSNGTLIMTDHDASSLSRIWCDFEVFMTIMNAQSMDIVALDEEHRPCLLTEKLLPSDEDAEDKAWRDMHFPKHFFLQSFEIALQNGNASQIEDKARILKAMVSMKDIVKNKNINWNDDGPLQRLMNEKMLKEEHLAYQLANEALHAKFAIYAWPLAHQHEQVKNFNGSKALSRSTESLPFSNILLNVMNCNFDTTLQTTSPDEEPKDEKVEVEPDAKEIIDLSAITSKAALLDRFEITLIGTNKHSFLNVFAGIPYNCRYVRLEFHDCENITDEVFFALWEKLSQLKHLIHFDIKIGNLSNTHSDALVTHPRKGLAAVLPKMKKLETLILDIEGDTYQHKSCFTEKSIHRLSKAIPSKTNLKTLKVDFGEQRVYICESKDEVEWWKVSVSSYQKDRPHHGFGNSLSDYAVIHGSQYTQKKEKMFFGPIKRLFFGFN
ncbi:hypothetical protein CTEN210_18549 [Chaetoceros tenuissimus]|uniref:Uncharacterized protein n=1 Tax=Chaetoceros tenuissimus TaxID=426638 RepID=A0AAD3HGE6_9STRA|nr:hypothetical protein CTEN210_18549 [Chaetoceros tenuissimus]